MPKRPDIRRRVLAALEGVQPVLKPLGAVYSLGARAWRRAHEGGLLASWRPPCPSVSVGNIGMGGSGKTPLCAHILEWAQARDELCVVLTRGYGAKPLRVPMLVTPGADPALAGDEPLLLASATENARVVVDPRRSRSGPWAWTRYEPDLVLLDDGFQHLSVQRDIDLVLLTPKDLAGGWRGGWNSVCPAGSWREGASALSRASAFCLKVTGDEFTGLRPALERRLARYGRPVFTFELKPVGLQRILGSESYTDKVRDLGGEAYVFACGLGNAGQAAATAAQLLKRAPSEVMSFPDHHRYRQADVQNIRETVKAAGAEHVVVTPKDAVKLAGLANTGGFWVLRTRFTPGFSLWAEADFDTWFTERFEALAATHREQYRAEILK